MKKRMFSYRNIVMQCTLILLVVMMLQNTAIAQDCRGFEPPSPADRAAHMTERMTEDLGLNETQAANVQAINEKYANLIHEKMEAFRAEGKRPSRADFDALKPLMEQKDAELKNVLTSEQYAKHMEFVKNRPHHFGPPPHHRAFGKRGGFHQPPSPADRAAHMTERMTEDLGLNETQAANVQAINEKYANLIHEKMEAFRAEGKRPSRADFDALKPLMEQKDAELKNVLTSEQYAKHMEFVKNRPFHFGPPPHHRAFGKRACDEEKFDPAQKGKLHGAIKEYMQKNVLPTVKQQRLKLEKEIVTEDKTKLDVLRGELAKVKPEMKAMHEKMRAAFEDGNRPTRTILQEMRAVKEQYHDVMQRTKPLANKYSEQIDVLFKEIAPNIKQWKIDIRALVKQELGEEKPRFGRHLFRKGGLKKLLHKGHFILLDPNGNMADFLEENTANKGNRQLKNVYPNPSNDSNIIEFQVAEAGNISIDLYDRDGQFVKTILNEYKEAGAYTVTVNLENLSRSTYYYVLKDGKGKEVKRFLIAN